MTIRNAADGCLDIEAGELWSRIEAASPRNDFVVSADSPLLDDDSSERRLSQSDRRRTFIANFAWAVPTRSAVAALEGFVRDCKLLEVCAGSGLWARLLSDLGVNVVATDGVVPDGVPFHPIEVMDAVEAVQAHPECGALLFCWPPYRQDCAFRALKAFAGDRVVYAGDARFAGDQQLHDLLASDWTLQDQIEIPAWPGLDDHVYLYTRRE